MAELFPQIEPYEFGLLEVNNIHKIYWEKVGNSKGVPILVLHGGPGAGGNISLRRFFDPSFYNIIIFDQRGSGRSTPSACIQNNTTQDLIEDIEKLRIFLKVDQWLVFGGSWGSSLSLAYSQEYPKNVISMILRGIFLCREKEIEWFLKGIRNIFPDYWNRFSSFLPNEERENLLASYYKRISALFYENRKNIFAIFVGFELISDATGLGILSALSFLKTPFSILSLIILLFLIFKNSEIDKDDHEG